MQQKSTKTRCYEITWDAMQRKANLAKVEVASSTLVSRSKRTKGRREGGPFTFEEWARLMQ